MPVAASHVSPGHACRHREVVLFDNNVDMWPFLTITLSKWSYLSKICVCTVAARNRSL
jgi:hypothetical protein